MATLAQTSNCGRRSCSCSGNDAVHYLARERSASILVEALLLSGTTHRNRRFSPCYALHIWSMLSAMEMSSSSLCCGRTICTVRGWFFQSSGSSAAHQLSASKETKPRDVLEKYLHISQFIWSNTLSFGTYCMSLASFLTSTCMFLKGMTTLG